MLTRCLQEEIEGVPEIALNWVLSASVCVCVVCVSVMGLTESRSRFNHDRVVEPAYSSVFPLQPFVIKMK